MVSTISGPIPPHPYYDKTDVHQWLNLPAPRVRPEAQDFAHHGEQGSIANVMLQIEGQRCPSASKHKSPPADHLKENVRRMRQIQREARHKQEDSKKPVKALWKSGKYESVPSKVREQLSETPVAPRPHSAGYLRAHSRTGWTPVARGGSQSARVESDRSQYEPSVPRATTAREVKLVRHDVDFVKANGRAIKHTQMRRSPSLTALDDLKKKQEDEKQSYNRGSVPKYLQSRKKQWEQEEAERVAAIPDPEMPLGHRRMEESERRDTLNKLQQTQTDLLQELGHMPIRTDTVTIRRKKQEMENKLAEIEAAIKIFSRRKVFVKLDT